MGDRVWTSIEFSGQVTREVAEGLVEQLDGQGCVTDDSDHNSKAPTVELLGSLFYDEECNYGEMDGVRAYCQEHHISYCTAWQSGGGFGEGCTLYNAVVDQTFTVPTVESEAALSVNDLQRLHEEGKTIEEVISYLKHINNFRNAYPPLEVSE